MAGDHMSDFVETTPPELNPETGMITRVLTAPARLHRNWLAVDFGQTDDFTAMIGGETHIQIARTVQRYIHYAHETQVAARRTYTYRIRNAHRVTLGTSYPLIATQIGLVLQVMPDSDLICDGTGVGKAVVDILRREKLRPISITITGGMEVNKPSWNDYRVPKTDLVGALQVAAQEQRIRIAPEIALRDVLEREIAAFTPRRTATGLLTFEGADGEHDDLVMALACGIWHQENRPAPAISMGLHEYFETRGQGYYGQHR
jgi:hypothetical protein